MDMNKAIPSPSDGSVTSKATTFTPLRFGQISSNQELPVPPNQLLLNGKVSLDPVLYNDGNYPALKPHYGYPVSILPSLNCLPEKTINMGANKAMPLPSDTAVTSKITSFTPLMFAQVPSNQFPLNGKLSLNPILCNGSNGRVPKPEYGYPISVLPNLNSLPEKTVSMDASKAMPSPSTPMIVEKKRFVQDCLTREVIDLVDESPSKEDKQEKGKWQSLVYKQARPNISKPVVSYSSEHLAPSQIVSFQQQMADRGIVQEEITWQSTLQKQLDPCFVRPTAKCSAFLAAVPSETAFSLEPTVQSPCEHVMTSQTISSLNQRADKGDMQEKELRKCQHPVQNQVEPCFSNSVGSSSSEPRVPSQVASSQQKQSEVIAIISSEVASSQQKQSEVNAIISSEVASSQQKQSEVNAIISSEEVPPQELDAEKQNKSENQRIDLNKTPQQKPKRKKHRPKVIREDKPARTPKPKTPKPVNPKQAKNKEQNPTGKRKYVRKKKVQNSPDNPTDALGEIVNPNNAHGTKSVRRCLNFDSEYLQARNGCLLSASTLTCNAESQAQKEYVAGPSMISSTKSTLHHCQGPEVVVGNSPTGITLDLNNSMNQKLNEFVNLAENPAPPLQPCRREMMGTNQMLDSYRRMPEDRIISPRPSKRELIKKNLNELARKNEYLKISTNAERSLETGQSRSDLHKISDVMLKSTKRDHNLVDDACFSESIHVTYANNGIDQVSECHDTGSNDPSFSENCKKRRIENEQNGQNGLTSIAASMIYKPLNNLRTDQVVPNNSEVFTFADAQWLMALEKQQASECMLSFDQAESNNRPTLPVQAHNSTSVSAIMDCNYRSTPVKQSGYSSADCTHTTTPAKLSGQSHVDYNQPSTPGKPLGGNESRESEICKLQPCMEDIIVNTNTRTKPKNRTKKKKDQPINPQSLKTSRMCLQEHEAAVFNSGSSPGQKATQATTLASGNSIERKSVLQTGSSLDCQSSNNFNESLNGRGMLGAIVPYGDPLDDITQKLRCLNINRWHDGAPTQAQNALVHYDGRGGAMVPYESLLDIARKRRPRAKVDLDPETNRVWKLLMGKEGSDEGTDMDKEKWWEEERRVFCGRVDSFIARMHLVQGDRRFSQWKGSVVDSVVGVFLTQNVSDHLSSSAFMALAARFPLKSRDNNWRPGAEKTNTSGEQQDTCMPASENATKWQESMLHKELYDRDSVVIIGEKERANSHESYGSNTGGAIADYTKGKCLGAHQRELEIGHVSPDSRSDTPATVIGSTSLAEVKDKRSVADVISSQNSVVSPQYSSECQVQTADQNGSSSFSNFEAEELIIGSVCNGMDSSTSFTELLRIAELGTHGNERIPSTDYCGAMDRSVQLDVDKRHTVLNHSEKLKGALPSMQTSDSYFHNTEHDILRVSCDPFVPYNFNNSKNSRLVGMHNANVVRDENRCPPSSAASGSMNTNKINFMDLLCGPLANNAIEDIDQQKLTVTLETVPAFDSYAQISKHVQPLTSLETEDYVRKCSNSNNPGERTGASLGTSVSHQCSHLQHECTEKFQQKEKEADFQVENTLHAVKVPCQKQNSQNQQIYPDLQNNQGKALETVEGVESNFKDESQNFQKVSSEPAKKGLKAKKTKVESEKKKTYDWDSLQKEAYCKGARKERSYETMDSLDWEAVRSADVKEISETIRERGMNNMLAERIKEFLNRLVRDHGSIDLEWLRVVEPDKAKDYLLSVRGLGLKSVECVRLLTLHHLAFPVDTNVGRICVRLGWVPLQPLPESLQLHLLELYPILETIQKYLWPRLCKLDQRTLYELHYQMITFGKVFCTKSKPNCNACPMRGDCKHFASAFASARLALPGPEEKSLMSSAIPIASEKSRSPSCKFPLPQLEGGTSSQERTVFNNCEPIIEEPATPDAEYLETEKNAIEDAFFEDPDEIPTIKLNFEEFTQNLQNYMQVHNMDIQDGDMSRALVAIAPEAASIPMPKLKNVSRLRTEHQVYELPDSHPLLEGLDRREPDDPCSYLLAIWTPGETAQSTEPPKAFCNSQETGELCDRKMCFACNSIREAQAQTVRGTLLIPCRTAMRGSFPLNGTYFQVNEVFADHDTSRNPIDVPREWIWNLPRRTVYFGTSIPTIFKGLTTEGIQQCFWRGFVCVRGFDRTTRAPKPLYARLHFPASKAPRNKKAAAAAARGE